MGSCSSVLEPNKRKDNILRIEVKEWKADGEPGDCQRGKAKVKIEKMRRDKASDSEKKNQRERNEVVTRKDKKQCRKSKPIPSLEIINLEETNDINGIQSSPESKEFVRRHPNERKVDAHCVAYAENKQLYNGQGEDNTILEHDRPETSRHYKKTSFTAPLPRPSEWHRVYTEKLKQKEKRADEKLKNAPKKKPKHFPSVEERDYAYKVSLIKRIKKSILESAASHGPESTQFYINATVTYFKRVFGINIDELESSSTSSTSIESENSSEGDLQGQRIGSLYQGHVKTQLPRRWFARKSNKIHPL